MIRSTLALILMLVAGDALAQPGMPGAIQRPGPLPGGRMQRPPRDPRDAPTGTSVIRGRIVAADTGQPIRKAQVRAYSGEVRDSRMASTDAQGRFELRDLPAGRWQLTASKAGFVALGYGQRRAFEPGRPLEIGDGETMAKADFALPRGAAMTGKILDEFGDPVAGARVMAMRYQTVQGQRRLMPAAGRTDETDDTGAFRLYGLPPGDYYVSASLRGMNFGEDSGDTTGYASTYYPGTGNVAEAQRVTLAIGQENPNVTFALMSTRTYRITGTVIDSTGRPVTNGFVMVMEDEGASFMMNTMGGRVRSDGSFIVANVPAGSFMLRVNSGMGPEESEFAAQRVTVGGDDLTGVNLVTGKGATLTGRIVAEPGSAGTLSMTGVQVLAQTARFEPMFGSRPGRVDDDGSFRTPGMSGSRLIRVMGLPPMWMMKQVLLNGDDITDRAIDFKGNDEVSGVQIIVTDKVTELNGKVTDKKGEPTRDYTVVVFPEDSEKWEYPSRYLRSARADQSGLFKVRGLPSEARYLAVAVDYIEDGEGGDPEFLRDMADRATRFSLGTGEVKALDLKLINR